MTRRISIMARIIATPPLRAALALATLLLAAYLAACGYLFLAQRHLVFQPKPIVLGDPPGGSGLQGLPVSVPGLGVLTDWWVPPTSRMLPTVVFFHGNASDRSDFLRQAQPFQARGWGVVLASYRGYSGNPGSPSEDGLMADARATLAAIASQVGPVIVWGHSLGSGVAARMASEGRAAGLVLESPYTVLTEVAGSRYPYVPVRWLMKDRFDTESLIGHIQAPTLVIHGTADPIIPFAMGQTLARALGTRATFVALPGVGHFPHRQDLSPLVFAWAQRSGIGPVAESVSR